MLARSRYLAGERLPAGYRWRPPVGCARPRRIGARRPTRRRGAGRQLVHHWRVPGEPPADEPPQPQPRAHRHCASLRRFAARRGLPAGTGGKSRPVIRISHDGGKTWRTAAGHPRGGGSHPMVAWGPGPRTGRARLYYTAMGGPFPYHFEVSYSDNEGRTWHLGFTAHHTARLGHRHRGHGRRYQPSEPELRHPLPRL